MHVMFTQDSLPFTLAERVRSKLEVQTVFPRPKTGVDRLDSFTAVHGGCRYGTASLVPKWHLSRSERKAVTQGTTIAAAYSSPFLLEFLEGTETRPPVRPDFSRRLDMAA